MPVVNKTFDCLLRDKLAHIVIGFAPGKNYLRVVSHRLGFIGEVVWIDANTMPSDKPRTEREKVPLGTGRLKHVQGINAKPVKYQRQFIHQGDIEVALGVLDYFCSLSHLDTRRAVDSRLDNLAIKRCHPVQGRGRIAGHYFYNRFQSMFFVAGIDSFRGVADIEAAVLPATFPATPGQS